MKFRDFAAMEYENLLEIVRKCGSLLQHLPRGSLDAMRKGERFYYNKYCDGETTYLRAQDPQIIQLKDRRLVEAVLNNADQNMQMLKFLVNRYNEYDPNVLLKSFSAAYQGVSQSVIMAMGFPYTFGYADLPQDNSKHPENLKHTTANGTKRRSKSELVIDGIYEMLEYQVAYEKELLLRDGSSVNPDYTVWVTRRNREHYHDHIGDLMDPQRRRTNTWKFWHYVDSGLYPRDRVLFTFDKADGSIDAEEITTLIKTFMQ